MGFLWNMKIGLQIFAFLVWVTPIIIFKYGKQHTLIMDDYTEMNIFINEPFEKFETSLPFSDYPFNQAGWFFDDYRHMINDSNLTLKPIQKLSAPQLLITKYKVNKFEFPLTNPTIINIDNIPNYRNYMLKTISIEHNIEIIQNTMYILMGKWGNNQCKKCQYNQKYNFPSKRMQKNHYLNAIGLILFDTKWNVLTYVTMQTNQNEHRYFNEQWAPFEDCKLFNYLSMVYFQCIAHRYLGENSFFGTILWKENRNKITAYIQWADTKKNVSNFLQTKQLIHTPPKHIKYSKPKNLIPLTYNKKLYFQWSMVSNANYIIKVNANKNTNDFIKGKYGYYNNNSNVTDIYEYHQSTGFIHLKHSNEYLGIGHVHYNFYEYFQLSKQSISWGSHYSHFFFTIEDKPPFNLKRISGEFCFVSPFTENNDSKDCDVIQFVVGMTASKINNIDYIFISYGVNDCISSVIVFNKTFVTNMLHSVVLNV